MIHYVIGSLMIVAGLTLAAYVIQQMKEQNK